MSRPSEPAAAPGVDLEKVVGSARAELGCLLGPQIRLETGVLADSEPGRVSVGRDEIEDLLRHLMLDARAAMPSGGLLTIRTGRLGTPADCGALVVHEVPDAPGGSHIARKGRSLGLDAAYAVIERASGHLHISCRDGATVITLCLPLRAPAAPSAR